jgi:isoleucyl-tRNA synthetase
VPKEFVEIVEIPDERYAMALDQKLGISVFLSLERDSELELDGLARETLRRIQVMRKEMDLQYDDRISVTIDCDLQFWEKLRERMEWISGESLANEIVHGKVEVGKEWEISGESLRIKVVPEKRVDVE